ncbi:MAG: hypothetical protein KBT36_01540 [Kurthia sp.]|nr:hypothetical protein [Candidatus Kurthia equi]
MKTLLNMEVTQAGEGDRQVISRIMTRLTIAKLFQQAGKDVSEFNFHGVADVKGYNDDYYSFNEMVSDIIEFIEGFDLIYSYDESTSTLEVQFPKNITKMLCFDEALSFGWSGIEDGFYDEEEDFEEEDFDNEESLISLTTTSFKFILRKYDGVPIKILTTFYELLKENELL